ncbi:PREDICTED: uncharacterized protein LOC109371702 isoform X2 [Hipposideros armiger]|uniref:Uncharacterized protein LOC109371702 isoform X2 n=1 Tax=Hipposideros armiger TaxID=186990 RepID=A0A8B7PXQ0_HIPAR|nr:PREDICTED: uncharacterized protein LOC109371702 isoform X2 [Hipposideros armiger]
MMDHCRRTFLRAHRPAEATRGESFYPFQTRNRDTGVVNRGETTRKIRVRLTSSGNKDGMSLAGHCSQQPTSAERPWGLRHPCRRNERKSRETLVSSAEELLVPSLRRASAVGRTGIPGWWRCSEAASAKKQTSRAAETDGWTGRRQHTRAPSPSRCCLLSVPPFSPCRPQRLYLALLMARALDSAENWARDGLCAWGSYAVPGKTSLTLTSQIWEMSGFRGSGLPPGMAWTL